MHFLTLFISGKWRSGHHTGLNFTVQNVWFDQNLTVRDLTCISLHWMAPGGRPCSLTGKRVHIYTSRSWMPTTSNEQATHVDVMTKQRFRITDLNRMYKRGYNVAMRQECPDQRTILDANCHQCFIGSGSASLSKYPFLLFQYSQRWILIPIVHSGNIHSPKNQMSFLVKYTENTNIFSASAI